MPIFLVVAGLAAVSCALMYGAVCASSGRDWLAVGAVTTFGLSLLVNL